jgi:antitoxin VapB
MGLNIKNREVEQLAAEVAKMADESKTEAIRRALLDRRARLQANGAETKRRDIQTFLERHVWPSIPPDKLGVGITQEEEDEILGYGPNGYCE